MAIINQSNILNLQPGITAPVVVHMSEGDVGTKLSFKLIDGARAWTDPGNVVAAAHGRRQDGTQFGPYACTISGDVVSFETDAAMAGAAGSGIAEIVLTDSNGNTAGSANFAVMVERATFPMGVTYTNDVSVYEAILAYAQSAVTNEKNERIAAVNAEATARQNADATLQNNIDAEATARQTADNTLQNNINSEASTRAAADQNLQAQISQIVAPSGEAPSAAEVQNARVGADGVTYPTLGDAIRANDSALKSAINDETYSRTDMSIKTLEGLRPVLFSMELGDIDPETGEGIASSTRLRTKEFIKGDLKLLTLCRKNKRYSYRAFFYDSSKKFIVADDGYYTSDETTNINPKQYAYIKFIIVDTTDGKWNNPMSISDASCLSLYEENSNIVLQDDPKLDKLPYYELSTHNSTITSVLNPNKTFKDGLNLMFDQIRIISNGKNWESLTIKVFNPIQGRKLHLHYVIQDQSERVARATVYFADGTETDFNVVEDTNDVFAVLPSRNDIDAVAFTIFLSRNTAGTSGYEYVLNDIYIEQYNDGILQQYPPYLMNDILANLKYHGNSYAGDYHLEPLNLIHFSDVHASKDALKKLDDFFTAYGNYIDDVIHTGDAVRTVWENGFDFWSSANASKFLNVIGNHDVWTWGNDYNKSYTRGYSAKQSYERYVAPFASYWGGAITVPDKCYWYKDYPSSNIRLIAIDCMHWKEKLILANGTESTVYKNGDLCDNGEQKTWLTNVLETARSNGLSVMCAVHYPAVRKGIPCSFMSLNAFALGELQTDIIQTVQTFIDNGGSFITWLCGHQHEDLFGTITNFPDQTMIAITDSYIGIGDPAEANVIHLPNTYAETNANILSIDPNQKFIRLMRIGGNYDKNGRKIGSLVYNYDSKQLLYNG